MENKIEKEISILITGDFYAGNRIDKLIRDEKYVEIFNDFLPEIQNADISVTNLESALTISNRPIFKTGPSLKASPKTIDSLTFAGFNLLTLANNHIMDFGEKGLKDTLELCNKNEINIVGAGMNLNEASQIYFKVINGKKLAFINFTENEWSTTQDNHPGANPLNPIANYYTIQEACKNADFVFVIVHGGHEMYQLPSPRMKQTYRFFINAGANAVIGHHTHCFSGYEIYNGNPIFYSLGNFIFDWPGKQNSKWNFGYAVKFRIYESKLSFDLLPFEQCNANAGVWKLKESGITSFKNEIYQFQQIILNDDKLINNFDEFCKSQSKLYKAFLEPHSNKYIYALQNRLLFPSFLSRQKRLLYTNLIKCEAHRDIIVRILNNYI